MMGLAVVCAVLAGWAVVCVAADAPKAPATTTTAAAETRPFRSTVFAKVTTQPCGEYVPEAAQQFDKAFNMYMGSIGEKDKAKVQKVIDAFEKIVKDFPKSDRAGAAAITIAHIYEQEFQDQAKVMTWLEKTMTLPDPCTAAEANWWAGQVYARTDKAKAIKYLQAALDSKLLVDGLDTSTQTRLDQLKEEAATQPTTTSKPAEETK